MNIAFLLAAGRSKRFGHDKLFALLDGKPVMAHSLDLFQRSALIDEIFIAASPVNKKKIAMMVKKEKSNKVKKIITGGVSRFESVRALIKNLPVTRYSLPVTNLIIHNAANPFATDGEIKACLKAIRPGISGSAVGRPVSATLKEVAGGRIKKTISRNGVWEMETPQVVRAKDFMSALKSAAVRQAERDMTDDLAVLEAAGFKTAVVKASPQNKKITTAEDSELLSTRYSLPVTRYSLVGIGEDSHAFFKRPFLSLRAKQSNPAPRRRPELAAKDLVDNCLILGGVRIKNMPALKADSDGDVILHALCNAISSALGRGSLGIYATKMAKRGVRDSKKYLEKNLKDMRRARRSIYNCAISIEAARPRIDPLVPRLKKNLAALLNISKDRIGITATSGEKLTPFGKGEAIKCQAVVALNIVRTACPLSC